MTHFSQKQRSLDKLGASIQLLILQAINANPEVLPDGNYRIDANGHISLWQSGHMGFAPYELPEDVEGSISNILQEIKGISLGMPEKLAEQGQNASNYDGLEFSISSSRVRSSGFNALSIRETAEIRIQVKPRFKPRFEHSAFDTIKRLVAVIFLEHGFTSNARLVGGTYRLIITDSPQKRLSYRQPDYYEVGDLAEEWFCLNGESEVVKDKPWPVVDLTLLERLNGLVDSFSRYKELSDVKGFQIDLDTTEENFGLSLKPIY